MNSTITTRSAYKCCVSGITLTTEKAYALPGRYIHEELMRAWFRMYGTSCLPDGSDVPPELKTNDTNHGGQLRINQLNFVRNEFNSLLSNLLSDSVGSVQNTILYFKVLISWLLVLDAREAIEMITRSSSLCAQVNDVHNIDIYTNFFDYTLMQIFSVDKDLPRVIQHIDEYKHSSSGRLERLDTAIIRFAQDIVLTSQIERSLSLLSDITNGTGLVSPYRHWPSVLHTPTVFPSTEQHSSLGPHQTNHNNEIQ